MKHSRGRQWVSEVAHIWMFQAFGVLLTTTCQATEGGLSSRPGTGCPVCLYGQWKGHAILSFRQAFP